MKAQEIREKLEKTREVVKKKEATLDKYYKKAEKIATEIKKRGWDIEAGRHQKYGTAEHEDCYWMFCDYDEALEGIDRTQKAIYEKKGAVAKWESKLQEAEETENMIAKKFPEIFRQYKADVTKAWDEYDKNFRERVKTEYNKLGYKEFIKKYSYNSYEAMYETDDSIHRRNEKDAERLIINLWNRIGEIVGEATDYYLTIRQGNEYEGAVINGTVKGTEGTANVETISAGGWNIQRFHYRTLVHRI